MSRKRRLSESHHDGQDLKQRQRMTHYHQSTIFQTTQQKLYDGSKTFFRKLKDAATTETNPSPMTTCCSSLHCTIPIVSTCDYCEKQYCSNHLTQCAQCSKIFCLFCSTNVNNEFSICLTCLRNEY